MSKKHAPSQRSFLPAFLQFILQTRSGMQLLGSTLVFMGLSAFFIYQAFAQQYEQIVEIFQMVDPSLQHELVMNDVFIRNLIFLGATAVVYAGSLGFIFFRAQQQVEGPLFAIEAFVADMIRGEYRHRIVTRKEDQLQDLVHSLNHMAEVLEQKYLRSEGTTGAADPASSAPGYDKTADV